MMITEEVRLDAWPSPHVALNYPRETLKKLISSTSGDVTEFNKNQEYLEQKLDRSSRRSIIEPHA